MLTSATLEQESWKSILFHPVLKVYPTHHSWTITTHISIGDLEKQWKMFIQQKARSQQLLNSLQQKPLAPNYLLSALQTGLANLDSIYTSYKPLIVTTTLLLKREPFFTGMPPLSKHAKRSLPREHPQLDHGSSHDQRYKDHQEKSHQANQNTGPTTRNIDTCHFNTKCHQICHTSQQTTHQHSHGSSWEDTQWCHYTLQYHKFNIHPHKLSTDSLSHLLHSGLSQGFFVLHETDSHACSGLHRCINYQ